MAKMENGISDAREATRQAMSEVSVAVVSCTLVFMAVFIPVTFMPGTSGTFFTQFGVTIASSVGLSCVSALTLCPALCAIMMRATEGKKEGKGLTYYTKKAYESNPGMEPADRSCRAASILHEESAVRSRTTGRPGCVPG